MLIKYIKSVVWRVSKCLSYIEEARGLKVKTALLCLKIPRFRPLVLLIKAGRNVGVMILIDEELT